MTVAELISQLQQCCQDREVKISLLDFNTDDIDFHDIEFVSIANDPSDDTPVMINTSKGNPY